MKKSFVFSLLAATAFATTTRATVVYDNYSTNAFYGYSSGTSVGQSFVTGSTPLNFTDLVFPQLTGSSSNGANAYTTGETVNLYANNPATNTPDTTASLASFTLTNVATGSNQGQTTAVPTAATFLSANTRYWLVLAAPNAASTVYWNYVNAGYSSNSALGVTLATTNTAFESNGSTTTYYSLADGPQMLRLDAVAVPEPSTEAMLALAGLCALLFARRAHVAKAA